ncbi:MAG TPA: hypothetical protein VMZ53_27205 [Kofleriaceae bacterium]|nr:hypothetical protein [Kofleriaceae bacterium]
MTKHCLLAILVLVAACKREGDHCEYPTKRCDGTSILECHIANANDDLLGHKSNYFERSSCPAGTQCVDVDGDVGCVDPKAECDPMSTVPVVVERGATIEIKACTNMLSSNGYYETATFTTCDPRTFKAKCLDGQSALNCVPGEARKGLHSVVREAVRGKYVETQTFCPVCGVDPTQCAN